MNTCFRLLALALALLVCSPAQAQTITPVPPDFVEPRQLPGEDPFAIDKPTFSRDGAYVAAFMHSPKTVRVWDVKTGEMVAEVADSVHGLDAVDGLEFSADGKQLLLLRHHEPMKFLDWKAGKVVREIPLNADPKKIMGYAFSPDMSLLAVSGSNGIALWDVKAGKKLKEFLKGTAVASVDMLITKDKQGKPVRLIGYGRFLAPPNARFEKVAGIINIDSGKVTTVLDDIPENKKVHDKMSFFFVTFEHGGSHMLVGYQVLPPTLPASAVLVDTWTGKYLANHDLAHKTLAFKWNYLWKPYYGYVVSTADLSVPMQPYKTGTQFLVATKDSLKPIDTKDEKALPVQSINFNRDNTMAVITQKKDMSDTSKIYLYKVVPMKK